MRSFPILELEHIEELSRIWYEHQILGHEPLRIQEKFYALIERIFEENKQQAPRPQLSSALSQLDNRQVQADRLIQVLQYDRDLIALLEKRCLELVRENGLESDLTHQR